MIRKWLNFCITNTIALVVLVCVINQSSYADFGKSCPGVSVPIGTERAYLEDNTAYGYILPNIDISKYATNSRCNDNKPVIDLCIKNPSQNPPCDYASLAAGTVVRLKDVSKVKQLGLDPALSTVTLKAEFIDSPRCSNPSLNSSGQTGVTCTQHLCLTMPTPYGNSPLACKIITTQAAHAPIEKDNTCRILAASCDQSEVTQSMFTFTGPAVQCLTESLYQMFFNTQEGCTGTDVNTRFLASFSSFQESLKITVRAMLILYTMGYGFTMLLNQGKFSLESAVGFVVKMMLVGYFSVGWGPAYFTDSGTKTTHSGMLEWGLPILTRMTSDLAIITFSAGNGGRGLCDFEDSRYPAHYSYFGLWDRIDCKIGAYAMIKKVYGFGFLATKTFDGGYYEITGDSNSNHDPMIIGLQDSSDGMHYLSAIAAKTDPLIEMGDQVASSLSNPSQTSNSVLQQVNSGAGIVSNIVTNTIDNALNTTNTTDTANTAISNVEDIADSAIGAVEDFSQFAATTVNTLNNVIPAVQMVADTTESVAESINDTFESYVDKLNSLKSSLEDLAILTNISLDDLEDSIEDSISQLTNLGEGLKEGIENPGATAEATLDALQEAYNATFDSLKETLHHILNDVPDAASFTIDAATTAADAVEAVVQDPAIVFDNVKNLVNDALALTDTFSANVDDAVAFAATSLDDAFDTAIDAVSDAANTATAGAVTVAQDVVANATDVAQNVISDATDIADNVISDATDIVDNVISDAPDIVDNLISDAPDIASETAEAMADAGQDAAQAGMSVVMFAMLLGGNIIVFICLLYFMTVIIALILGFVSLYTVCLVTLHVLIYVSPIFVPFVLFSRTKQYYDAWLKITLSCALQPMVMAGFIAFTLNMYEDVFYGGCEFLRHDYTNGERYFSAFELRLPRGDYGTCIASPGYMIISYVLGYGQNSVGAIILTIDYIKDELNLIANALLLLSFSYIMSFFSDAVYGLSADLAGGINVSGVALNVKKMMDAMRKKLDQGAEKIAHATKKGGAKGGKGKP